MKWLPNDEKAIRHFLTRLAQDASVKPNDSGFARLAYANRLADFFATNAVLHLEGLGTDFPTVTSRSDLIEAAMAARTQLHQADFKLTDCNVTFPGQTHLADAYVVISGTVNQQTNSFGQAFKMTLQKSRGHWLIQELTTVQRLQ